MKKLFCTLSIALSIALLLTACGSTGTPSQASPTEAVPAAASSQANPTEAPAASSVEPIIIRCAHSLTENDPVHKGFVKFGELLEERTDGRYKVEIYPNGVFGTDTEITEAVQMGNVDVISCHSATMANFSPIWYVFDLPFAFPTEELYDKVVGGDLGKIVADTTEKDMDNVVVMGIWERGYRCLTCNKPVYSAADMVGVRMRVMENALHQGYWLMVGADPATLPWADVYVALQQKAMDAHDNAVSLIVSANLNEVQSNLMLTNHILSSSGILMNADKFNAMSPEDQVIAKECMAEAGVYQDAILRNSVASDIDTLRSRGMNVLTADEIDLESFKVIAEKFCASLGEEYSAAVNLYDQIKALK